MISHRSLILFAATLAATLVVSPDAHAGPLPTAHPKIDSHAQFALADLASKGGSSAREAVQLVAAVTSGRLGGVYLSNQGVPAQRAQAWGTTWWEMIPKGTDGVVVPPGPGKSGKPIVVLRHTIASKPAARNAALLDGWRSFAVLDAGVATPCNGGATWIRQIVGSKHCLPAAPLPSSMTAPKSLFVSGGTVLSGFGPHYGNDPKCHRVNLSYGPCKSKVGKRPDLPAIKPAHQLEGISDPELGPLTKNLLLSFMKPAILPANAQGIWAQRRKQQIARLTAAVPKLNEAFEVYGLNTPRSRAHYLAHFGGETGGSPSFFRLREFGADNASYAPFIGRGPVQVTHRKAYVLTLAYTDKRARMASAESAKVFSQLGSLIDSMLQGGTITPSKLQQVEALAQKHEAAVRRWLRLVQHLESIKGDETKAEQPFHGFLFSGAFWHASMCSKQVKQMGSSASQQDFIGSGLGSACVAGGATSLEGNDRAKTKAAIYNKVMQHYGGLVPSQSGGVKPKLKPGAKKKLRRKIRLPRGG